MCEKALEIQELHIPQEGDFIINGGYKLLEIIIHSPSDGYLGILESSPGYEYNEDEITSIHNLNFIWLPRQDQLLDMVDEFLISSGETGYCVENKLFRCFADTLEQALMKFVMRNKFNKMWNFENWIEIKREYQWHTD